MKPNNERIAEIAADSSTDADVTPVSQHSSKPNVVRSPFCRIRLGQIAL
jgi:hypothetical protein